LTGELNIEGYVNTKNINFERYKTGGVAENGKITKVIIKNCPKLETINLDRNEITEIVFEGTFNAL